MSIETLKEFMKIKDVFYWVSILCLFSFTLFVYVKRGIDDKDVVYLIAIVCLSIFYFWFFQKQRKELLFAEKRISEKIQNEIKKPFQQEQAEAEREREEREQEKLRLAIKEAEAKKKVQELEMEIKKAEAMKTEMEKMKELADLPFEKYLSLFADKLEMLTAKEFQGKNHSTLLKFYTALKESFVRNNLVPLERLEAVSESVYGIDEAETIIDLYGEKINRVKLDESLDEEEREEKIEYWRRLRDRHISQIEGGE